MKRFENNTTKSGRPFSSAEKEERRNRWRELISSDRFGDQLQELATNLAEGNESGQVDYSTCWRKIGEPYVHARAKGELTDESWAHGFDETIWRGIGSICYVRKVARDHQRRAAAPRHPSASTRRRRDGRKKYGQHNQRETFE